MTCIHDNYYVSLTPKKTNEICIHAVLNAREELNLNSGSCTWGKLEVHTFLNSKLAHRDLQIQALNNQVARMPKHFIQ